MVRYPAPTTTMVCNAFEVRFVRLLFMLNVQSKMQATTPSICHFLTKIERKYLTCQRDAGAPRLFRAKFQLSIRQAFGRDSHGNRTGPAEAFDDHEGAALVQFS
jgi:hypothetical protein